MDDVSSEPKRKVLRKRRAGGANAQKRRIGTVNVY